MKNVMKGMIIFFTAVMLLLIGFMIFVLIRGRDSMPFLSSSFSEKLIRTQNKSLSGVKEINIKGENCDVFFKQSDSSEIVIKEYGTKQYKNAYLKIDVNNGTLNIEAERDFSRSWLVFGNRYRYFEVYLPQEYKRQMAVETSSGDINAKMDLELSDFSAQASSGYAYLSGIKAKTVSLYANSGDINVKNAIICEKLDVNTSSGYIKFDTVKADEIILASNSGDINAKVLDGMKQIKSSSGYINVKSSINDMDCYSSSGDISVREHSGKMNVESTSGYIDIYDINGSGSAQTSSGDITLKFADLKDNINIDTTSGYVECSLPADETFEFSGNTNSGELNTYFDDMISFNKNGNKAKGMVGENTSYKVEVNTSSGDIELKKN